MKAGLWVGRSAVPGVAEKTLGGLTVLPAIMSYEISL